MKCLSALRPHVAFVAVGMILCVATATGAPPVTIDDPVDRQIVDAFLEHTKSVPTRITADHCKAMAAEEVEGFTWKILPYAEMPLVAYELTGDPAYLDIFVETFGNMRAAMTEGPRGYLGWYGKALPLFQHPDHPEQPVDVLINSFRTVNVLSRFIELIDQEASLRARYAQQRESYLDLMTNHLVEKWSVRGNYVDLCEQGAIYRTHSALKPVKGNLTQPQNKLSIITHGLLALYRVTGDSQYMTQAVKLGTHFKRRLTLHDNAYYTWNYWDPAGAWDVNPEDPGRWKHWIGAEHRAGYYGHSVAFAVELYHHGVVFDEVDIQRFLNTQMNHAWNGDVEEPQFHRVDGSEGKQSGQYLSSALAPWNEKLARFLYSGEAQAARLEAASHPWQGGPVAAGWIHGKFIALPAARGGRPIHADAGERFRQDEANRALLEALAYEVRGAGYQAPRTPGEMPDMPTGDCGEVEAAAKQ